jgi:hypothetical protein
MDLRDHVGVLDPRQIRDIRPEALGEDGRLRVLPTSYWESTTADERALFGKRTGLYSFPTVELVERLREMIAGRLAIEIGAGHGVLADALGIPGTDSFQQRVPKYRAMYERSGHTLVPYGPTVIDMHASRAVRYYRPEIVIGCWVTHKYDPKEHERGGNEVGVDEPDILRHCAKYVMIGHTRVHQHKPLWEKCRHAIEYPSYVVSRAMKGGGGMSEGQDFLAIFEGSRT